MGESTVGLGHFVHILLALKSAALEVVSRINFGSQFLCHRVTATFASVDDHIFDRESNLAVGADFGRNLESCATNATAFYLDSWGNILESFLEVLEGLFAFLLCFGSDGVDGVVEDTEGG